MNFKTALILNFKKRYKATNSQIEGFFSEKAPQIKSWKKLRYISTLQTISFKSELIWKLRSLQAKWRDVSSLLKKDDAFSKIVTGGLPSCHLK